MQQLKFHDFQPFPGHFWDNATVPQDPWSLGPTYSGAGGEAYLGPVGDGFGVVLEGDIHRNCPWKLVGNHGFYIILPFIFQWIFTDFEPVVAVVFFYRGFSIIYLCPFTGGYCRFL